jgi:hypothetical protein
MCVLFANCCPGEGKLYDEFKICDLETGEVIYSVVPLIKVKQHFGAGKTDSRGR